MDDEKRRDTEETRLSEPVRMKSGWENFGRMNTGKDIEAGSASDTASASVLATKGESEIRFPRRHEKGKCSPEKDACQKINSLLSFHDCTALRPQASGSNLVAAHALYIFA